MTPTTTFDLDQITPENMLDGDVRAMACAAMTAAGSTWLCSSLPQMTSPFDGPE